MRPNSSEVLATLNPKAMRRAALATAMLMGASVVGSRNLRNFDVALVAYLFGTLFAAFGTVYRYSAWVERPPTRRYFRRAIQHLFSRRFPSHAATFAGGVVREIILQRFIFRRSVRRGLAHWLLAWGCIGAFGITVPLTLGWVHFTLSGPGVYQAHVFGFEAFTFGLHSAVAWLTFNALSISSFLVLAGVAFYLRRRITDAGQIATQTFEMDWLPLLLLAIVALTGLGVSWDYEFFRGRGHAFMAITHAVSVIMFLVWIPFGKFFHIVQRPAQLGVLIYQREGAMGLQQVCPHTSAPFASALHVADLKDVTAEVGLDFSRKEGTGSHLDRSPEGKRAAIAKAHFLARKRSGSYFG